MKNRRKISTRACTNLVSDRAERGTKRISRARGISLLCKSVEEVRELKRNFLALPLGNFRATDVIPPEEKSRSHPYARAKIDRKRDERRETGIRRSGISIRKQSA